MRTALSQTARALVAHERGILVLDEGMRTCNRRFREVGVPETAEARRAYREWIVATPGLANSLNATILGEETVHQSTRDGIGFCAALSRAGIIPGIAADLGAAELPLQAAEQVATGLDGLHRRLFLHAHLGARFAAWRSFFLIGDGLPSPGCVAMNAYALARFAAASQADGLVPVLGAEVLTDGDHPLDVCAVVTEQVLRALFHQLGVQGVELGALVLTVTMVLPGERCARRESTEQVASATVQCLRNTVPEAVTGIAFLSGNQGSLLASTRLNAIAQRYRQRVPWPMTFAFSQALLHHAFDLWRGRVEAVPAAQEALAHRARCNQLACRGSYAIDEERAHGWRAAGALS
jgi:fructose-bisphosphate aldolase class I